MLNRSTRGDTMRLFGTEAGRALPHGVGGLQEAWSASSFADAGLAGYAAPHIARDTRQGVSFLAVAALLFLAPASGLAAWFGLGDTYLRTYVLLAALALHIFLSARRVHDVRALKLLAMALLTVSASALVLLARAAGGLHIMLLLSVATLIMLIPLVPWGLREALLTSAVIYVMFTALTFFSPLHVGAIELWSLQFTMLSAAVVSLALVGRALALRKHELAARFALEQAHAVMAEQADRDHLTGARNRRFLERDFDRVLASHRATGTQLHFGLLDIDHFKRINDTYGHLYGDAVLQALAEAFAGLDGEHEYLARLGGDEFAFILRGPAPQARLEALLDDAAALALRHAADGRAAPGVSAGLVTLDAGKAWTLDTAYAEADRLLYDAKRGGRARINHQGFPE
jgi:diguanylate cyclase (GGDEF)-like protein